MNGKGSKPRPIEVDRAVFESNWDRIFSKKDDTWTHNCEVEGLHAVGKGEECNWCGCIEEKETRSDS